MTDARIKTLNRQPVAEDGRYVLYWMQQAQRAAFNHALEHAIDEANAYGKALLVVFGLYDAYPEANERHFAFMLQGLAETARALAKRKVKFVVQRGSPDEVALDMAQRAVLVVCDRGYLRHQRAWRDRLAADAPCQVVEVESDVVVPVEVASNKREYAARTIRKKITSRSDHFLRVVPKAKPKILTLDTDAETGIDLTDWPALLEQLDIDRSVRPSTRFQGGGVTARRLLRDFLKTHLAGYANARNDPARPQCSRLSPYLHFGQISPLEIALAVKQATHASDADREAFLEELIVRRELAINFVTFTDDYDRYETLPDWALQTLAARADDPRDPVYSEAQLIAAQTHDPYWNAAMMEMVKTGYMHNYMRMYWGKKILEWSPSAKEAYDSALKLNNRYLLDGRDANSYANIGWLFGLHDRPWQERPIFGKVRYMNANGLKRKFDIESYVAWVASLEA